MDHRHILDLKWSRQLNCLSLFKQQWPFITTCWFSIRRNMDTKCSRLVASWCKFNRNPFYTDFALCIAYVFIYQLFLLNIFSYSKLRVACKIAIYASICNLDTLSNFSCVVSCVTSICRLSRTMKYMTLKWITDTY